MRHSDIAAATLAALRRQARRVAQAPHEADDLVQDVLLAAVEQQRDCTADGFAAWASGAIRLHARFVARGAGRRRRRERHHGTALLATPSGERRMPAAFIDGLPPALRMVALLVNLGLGRAEIAHLLALPDTALRQRVSALKRAWRSAGHQPDIVPPGFGLRSAGGGLTRRALKAGLARLPHARLAVIDPDGHEIFVSVAHKMPGRGNDMAHRQGRVP